MAKIPPMYSTRRPKTPQIEDVPLPPVGVTPPPAPPSARRPKLFGGRQQIVTNVAAPYGTPAKTAFRTPDQMQRVREGTISPRNPMPGRGGNPRRPPSR